MKAPITWLSEFIKTDSQITASLAAAAFTQLGFEIEDIVETGAGLSGDIRIGRVLEIEELTEFKKPIRFCQVQVGSAPTDINGIVCGASNFKVGDLVVVALPGSVLPGDFRISQRETYGKISNGMICSLRELGIADDHSGILVLEDDFEVGSDAISSLALKDSVLDLAVLPDRGYALSIRGLARELAMSLNSEYVDPVSRVEKIEAAKSKVISAQISASQDCTALHLSTLDGFDPDAVTPWVIRRKLMLAGMRPVSLAVDVTNYVMLLLGQPLHAFDMSKVKGAISIRYANPAETLETLDHQKRMLAQTDLVVADEQKALSLAGVMGGVDSEISENTKEIVLEAAHFSATRVAETARRHVFSSEASRRFERGVDPAIAIAASDLACQLLITHGGAQFTGRDSVAVPLQQTTIDFDFTKFIEIAGYDLDLQVVFDVLQNIGCEIDADLVKVTVPTWRPDLFTTNDLAEEVLRVTGYDKIPSKLPSALAGRGLSADQRALQQIRTYLAANGLSEIINYPFESDENIYQFGDLPSSVLVKLSNPLSEEEPYLRNSLLPGLISALKRNFGRGNSDIAVFEIGKIFLPNQGKGMPPLDFPLSREKLAQIDQVLPFQPLLLGVVLTGRQRPWSPIASEISWNWSDVINVVGSILHQFSVPYETRSAEAKGFHPGRTAEFWSDGTLLGIAGELHPKLQENLAAPNRIGIAQLNLSEILNLLPETLSAVPLSNYPIAKEDLAVVVAEEIPVAQLLSCITELDISELESFEVFDIYRGDQVPVGQKSVAVALRFRSSSHTLTTEEITEFKAKILQQLQTKFGAQLRQ